MKKIVLGIISFYSASSFGQEISTSVQEWYQTPLGITLIISFLVLLVSYIIALNKTQKGEMVVFVNKYDFALMFSSYLFLVLMFFSPLPSYQWLFLSVSVATFITSLVWSVLANNKDVKLGILAVLAKLFLMSVVLAILIIYTFIKGNKKTKVVEKLNGKNVERTLTDYERMEEEEKHLRRKQRAFAFISFLLLSLVVGTKAYKKVLEKNDKDEQKVEEIIQKIDWKNLLYIFCSIAILVLSVGYFSKFPTIVNLETKTEQSSETTNSSENTITNTTIKNSVKTNQTNASQQETNEEENQGYKPPKSITTPDFDAFFKKFNLDTDFQKSRVVFPLKQKISEYGEIMHNTISEEDYQSGTIDENSSMYWVVKEVKGNKAKVTLIGNENGIYEVSFFEKRNGDWFLVSTESASD